MSNPIVKVTEGQLSGKICNISDDKQYFAFKGIPYARPPLGELRFAVSFVNESLNFRY